MKGFFAAKALLRAFSRRKGVPDFKVDPTATPHYDPNTHTVTCKGTPCGDCSEEALINFRAALDHELSESQVTEWPQELNRRYGRVNEVPKGLGDICNGIGDVKVDNWIGGQYPGTELNIWKAIRMDFDRFTAFNKAEPIDPTNPMNRVKIAAVACRYVGDQAVTVDEVKLQVPQLADMIEELRSELENPEWDGTVGELVDQAERIREIVLDHEPPAPEGEGEDGESEGEGEEGEGESGDSDGDDSDSGTEGSNDSDEADDSEADGEGSSQDDTEGDEEIADGEDSSQDSTEGEEEDDESDSEADGSDDSDDSEADDEGDDDPDASDDSDELPEADFDWNMEENMLGEWSDETSANGNQWLVNDSNDEIVDEANIKPKTLPDWEADTVKDWTRKGSALAIKIKRALETATLLYRRNRDYGGIDPRNIHRVAAGLPRGMRKRLPQQANDTAIVLGLDASASMHKNHRVSLCRSLMFIWNDALHRLNIPLMVYSWATGRQSTDGAETYDVDTSTWSVNLSRCHGLLIEVLKDFDTNGGSPDCLNRLNAYRTANSTPTAEGLAFGLEKLIDRPERKKILFFLTDGLPDGDQRSGACWDMTSHVALIKATLAEAKRLGILVVVLGMDCEDEAGIFGDHWLRVHSEQSFVNVTSTKLVKLLLAFNP
jgi:hypothetical protein